MSKLSAAPIATGSRSADRRGSIASFGSGANMSIIADSIVVSGLSRHHAVRSPRRL
jgi:hypothetical protein